MDNCVTITRADPKVAAIDLNRLFPDWTTQASGGSGEPPLPGYEKSQHERQRCTSIWAWGNAPGTRLLAIG